MSLPVTRKYMLVCNFPVGNPSQMQVIFPLLLLNWSRPTNDDTESNVSSLCLFVEFMSILKGRSSSLSNNHLIVTAGRDLLTRHTISMFTKSLMRIGWSFFIPLIVSSTVGITKKDDHMYFGESYCRKNTTP